MIYKVKTMTADVQDWPAKEEAQSTSQTIDEILKIKCQ